MRRTVLRLTLEDDVVLSERAATLGGHRGLDYIPGAALLGAAAQRLYRRMGREEAWTAFHSGKVRFGDGLPIAEEGAVALPRPHCWHTAKEDSADFGPIDDRGYLKADRIWNLRFGEDRNDAPSKALPEAWHIARSGEVASPRTALRMKTAIDKGTGMRRETALFGYDALRAGQRFAALLEADAEVPRELFDRVRQALTQAPLRLGRSRQTEYGGVRCEEATADGLADELAPPPGPPLDPVKTEKGYRLVLWLLADLALEDEHGRPLLTPRADQLHPALPAWPLDRSGSFIRTRRFSPYNGYLRSHEVERVAIARGSVLEYRIGEEADAAVATALAEPVGLYREAGLGRLWANSGLLATPMPAFDDAVARLAGAAASDGAELAPGSYAGQLHGWLSRRVGERSRIAASEAAADEWRAELEQLYRSGRELAGAVAGVPFGPTPSQWGRVLELARNPSVPPAELDAWLFQGRGDKPPICPDNDEAWAAEGLLDEGATSFGAWLEKRIAKWHQEPRGDLRLALGHLANEGRRIAVETMRPKAAPPEAGVSP